MPLSSKPEAAEDPSEELSQARRACRKQALDLLARREHSRLELEHKLLDRAHARRVVEAVLEVLETEGLLADERFAESFVRARAGKGQGPVRIRAELLRRGVDEATVHAELADAPHDWSALAARARAKRFGAAPPGDFAERARQMRFLQHRGFEGGQIQAALDIAADSD